MNVAAPFINFTKGFIAICEAAHEDGNRIFRRVVTGNKRAEMII